MLKNKQVFNFDFENYRHNKKSQNKFKGHFIALIVTLVIWFILDYLYYPPYNFQDIASLMFMGFILGLFAFLDMIFTISFNSIVKGIIVIIAVSTVLVFALLFIGSPIISADKYRNQLDITEVMDFTSDFKEISLTQIPIVDKDAAIKLGDKKLGEVSGLGSQFFVDDNYTLVSSNNKIYRLAPLEHQSFIKWWQNRNQGVPGYIKVNVNDPNDVDLVILNKGMIYMPSAYFDQNLYRHVRFKYRTELFRDFSFEVDDNGNPFWVISVYKPEIGAFNGLNAVGAIICNPFTGEMEKYDMKDVPKWVDRVQPMEFAWEQLDNWGRYVHGFINTFFGQKDMLQTSEGYNYISIEGKTYAFTGVTSVGGEQSIVGFALINLRDSEAKFYKIGGADERSAMESAEGQVQNLKYKATFPILLNIAKNPTYFISLKDGAGLVKMFSFVNVSNYSIVGVGHSLEEAQADYVKRLTDAGVNVGNVSETFTTLKSEVIRINSAIINGNSMYYISLKDSNSMFIVPLSLSNELPMTKVGDIVEVKFIDNKNKAISPISFDNLNLDY